MEGIFRDPQESSNRKKRTNLKTAARAALAGAAFLSAISGTESKAEALLSHGVQEQHEAFNAEREADAFIDKVASMQLEIKDARERQNLHMIVEEYFNIFALALDTHTLHFSIKEPSSLVGEVSLPARERARQYLLPRILVSSTVTFSPAIDELRKILIARVISPEFREKLGDW
jgi:hypothetical protein